MTDDHELDELDPDTPTALLVRVEFTPEAAKVLRKVAAEARRLMGVQLGQRPPLHTQRVLDEHADHLRSVVDELDRAIANPIAVPVPDLAGE
jgi:hypothetical protein